MSRLGINHRSANRWMNCALVIQKTKFDTVSNLSQKKLLELGNLSDGELEALGEGQTVAGLSLDELDKMSYSELKTQIRGHKAELEAQKAVFEKVFAQKDKALTEKDNQMLQLEKEMIRPTPEEVENQLRSAIGKKKLELLSQAAKASESLKAYRRTLGELCGIQGIEFAHLQDVGVKIDEHLATVADALESCSEMLPLSPGIEETEA